MRNLINAQEDMFCLNGEIIEIEGIRIGGCDSWYDGSYIKKHFNKTDDTWIHQLWKYSLNDANYILGIPWQDLWQQEKEKIEKIYQEVDIMITHVNPSIAKKHTDPKYQEELTTGFFCFDGEEYLKQGSMKYWIYGHTHDAMEYELHGVTCICNPLGYPGEGNSTLRRIEV
jgi:DNA repair exonuclease SbcCD nuclease subunit